MFEQKANKWEILEEHTNAKVASKREIELQKQYGYLVDKIEYWKVLQNQRKGIKTRTANTDYKARTKKVNWEQKAIKSKKPINQYDLEGNFIKQWDGAKDAAIALDKKVSPAITECCQGKRKMAYKFIWKYA